MNQFTNLSSWREDNIVVKSGECYQLSFIDTKPNMFYVQNPNNCKLKISISKIPTKTNYEFLINPNSSEPMGRPMPTGNLYILNTGTVDATLKIYSIADKFDMNILKNFSVSLDGVTVETNNEISFKHGVSLPSGNNNIGIVSPDSETAGNIETIVEKVSETNSAVSGNMLAIKNNVTGCVDNSRNILWQLEGRESADGSSRQLVKEIADGINQINEQGVTTQFTGEISTEINKDVFWKKEETKEFSITLTKEVKYGTNLIKSGTIVDDYKGYFIDINASNMLYGSYYKTGSTGYYHELIFSDITESATLTINLKENAVTPNIIKTYTTTITVINGFVSLTELLEFIQVMKESESDAPINIEPAKNYDLTLYKIVNYKYNIISGVLYDMNRITEYTHSANYVIKANSTITISDEFATEGQKMWDKITMISSENDELKIKIYFTPNNYVQFKNTKSQPIKDLNIPVYAIELINDTSSVINVAMIGGKF